MPVSVKHTTRKDTSTRSDLSMLAKQPLAKSGSAPEERLYSDLAPFALVRLLRSPACLVSAAGGVLHLNKAWQKLGAAEIDEDGLSPWAELIWREDRRAALAQFRCATIASQGVDFECRLGGNGSVPRWFLISLHPLVEGLPDGRGWVCTASDIHDLKSREIDLERRASVQTDMLNISVDCIKLIALDGTLIHMNKAGCLALGVAEDSSFGMLWLPLLPQDVWAAGEQALTAARQGRFARFPGSSILPGQKTQYWDNMLTPVMGADGRPTTILCVSREVTGERQVQEALRQSEERLAIAAEVGGLGIWDYDIGRDQLYCDATWYRIMGREPNQPIQSIKDFQPFIHPDDMDRTTEVNQTAAELIAAGRDYAIMFRIIRPDGDVRWIRSAACVVQDDTGKPARAVGFVVDVTAARRGELALRDANRALKEEKTSLARQNREDPLTGIFNRRHLNEELTRICAQATGAQEMICIGLIDVDYFKAYNDRYGHLAGDAALCRIASALQSVARHSDFVARYGGEEFAFVLCGVTDPAPLLDRLAEAVSELAIVHADSSTGCLTISCGCILTGSCKDFSPTELLKAADEALYEAKAAGRNRHVIRNATDRHL